MSATACDVEQQAQFDAYVRGHAGDVRFAYKGIGDVRHGGVLGWGFGDFVFGAEFYVVADMTKIRLSGFADKVDSAKAIIAAIRRQQANRVNPI